MERDIEKDLIEIECAIKEHEKRDNTFTTSVLQRCYELVSELRSYRDLEEQGLLLKLPCKVGDKLYVVNSKNEISESTVKEFIYRAYRIPRLEIYFEDASGFETCLFDGTLNENVFITQSEAEEALKRMEMED